MLVVLYKNFAFEENKIKKIGINVLTLKADRPKY